MRIGRTTKNGTYYEANVADNPSQEMLEALDAIVNAAVTMAKKGDPGVAPAGQSPPTEEPPPAAP
jgi:hypothetical protein